MLRRRCCRTFIRFIKRRQLLKKQTDSSRFGAFHAVQQRPTKVPCGLPGIFAVHITAYLKLPVLKDKWASPRQLVLSHPAHLLAYDIALHSLQFVKGDRTFGTRCAGTFSPLPVRRPVQVSSGRLLGSSRIEAKGRGTHGEPSGVHAVLACYGLPAPRDATRKTRKGRRVLRRCSWFQSLKMMSSRPWVHSSRKKNSGFNRKEAESAAISFFNPGCLSGRPSGVTTARTQRRPNDHHDDPRALARHCSRHTQKQTEPKRRT